MTRTKYKVIQYDKQKNDSPGVSGGMWAVIRLREEAVAFGDARSQAEEIKKALKSVDPSSVDDDALF